MIDYSRIPEHMREGTRLYIEHGVTPGDFLRAALENNFIGVVERADYINKNAFFTWAQFLVNDVPWNCRGSREKVDTWMAHRGLEGLKDA